MVDFNFSDNKELILFDGVCNLCNQSIQYIIKHDKLDRFRFTPLQSEAGKWLLEYNGIDSNEMDSILLFTRKDKYYYKSTAALRIASKLGFPRNLLSIFLIIPTIIRNWIYDYVAANRYKWYGKKEECMIPTPELKNKFID